MNIYGKDYSHPDVLKRCNPGALYGARRVTLADGRGRGQRLVEVGTSAGLRAVFMEDKCLDILSLEYKGVNLGFLSKNGIVAVADTAADSFTKYWAGGFMSTCGLRNTGPACKVGDEFFPLHGVIGQTPAENVCVSVDENEIVLTGKIRETALFGHNLEMERRIVIPADGAEITVNDSIMNLNPEPESVFLLYHINFGFPFLDEGLEIRLPKGKIKPRSDFAAEHIADMGKITAPVDGQQEMVYFCLPDEKEAGVTLSNKNLGICAKIVYDSVRLPVLTQWKCMRSGDYALGIEPGTSFIRGRKEELENGYNVEIPGFRSFKYGFTVTVEDIQRQSS